MATREQNVDEMTAQKTRGTGNEVAAYARSNTFWKVCSSEMSLDLTCPDMNSIGLGVYASRTILVKMSGDVFSTQSACAEPSGFPMRAWHFVD